MIATGRQMHTQKGVRRHDSQIKSDDSRKGENIVESGMRWGIQAPRFQASDALTRFQGAPSSSCWYMISVCCSLTLSARFMWLPNECVAYLHIDASVIWTLMIVFSCTKVWSGGSSGEGWVPYLSKPPSSISHRIWIWVGLWRLRLLWYSVNLL